MTGMDRSLTDHAAQPASDVEYDCIVVGGGPAGLSAALYLGRLRRSVLVIDDEHGRSTWHQVNRNYLGFPSGVHATSLRELGEKQAIEYGVRFLNAPATDVSSHGTGRNKRFHIDTTQGSMIGRTIILAMGVSDKFPEFDGSLDCIGRSMFWCILCDGYESIDQRVVVLGHNDRAAALALQLLVFTSKVILVAGEESLDISDERRKALHDHGVEVYDCGCKVYTCETKGELQSIELSNGTKIELDRLFVAQWIEPNTQLAKELGVKLDEHNYILTDAEQLTNIEGVYAAGDITRLFNHQVTSAVHEGGMAAAAANYYLYEDWQKE